MGKKSTPKVDTTPVSAIKSAKKGKRGAEEAIEKVVSAKKVKLENDEAVKAKQKLEKKQPKKAVLKKTKKGKKDSTSESSDSSESESDVSDEEPKVTNKPAVVKNGTKKDASSSDESDSDSDSSDEETTGDAGKPSAKASKDDSDSEEEGLEESSDDEPSKVPQANNAQASEKSNSSEDSSDEDSEESEEEEGDDHPVRTLKKKDTDVEMVDGSQNQTKKSEQSTAKKTPITPKTPQGGATGSKTLFVGNLSFTVEENDVREFLKNAGEVVDVRLACNPEGQFKGYGHVEFATPEDAQKALELDGQKLLDRDVRLDIAHERAAYTPHSKAQSLTVFVKGFDTAVGEDEIRSALQEHFGPCGEITRLSIPPDHESGGVKGMAYIDFTESDGFNKALELNGSQVGGFSLFVQEAKPRGDNRDSGGRGGRSGGRFGGRGSNSGGRFGGRGGRGGRFGRGGRGGGGRGGGGRGRGTPNKAPAGKKTTFGDD